MKKSLVLPLLLLFIISCKKNDVIIDEGTTEIEDGLVVESDSIRFLYLDEWEGRYSGIAKHEYRIITHWEDNGFPVTEWVTEYDSVFIDVYKAINDTTLNFLIVFKSKTNYNEDLESLIFTTTGNIDPPSPLLDISFNDSIINYEKHYRSGHFGHNILSCIIERNN